MEGTEETVLTEVLVPAVVVPEGGVEEQVSSLASLRACVRACMHVCECIHVLVIGGGRY